jgi:hypothetical protein
LRQWEFGDNLIKLNPVAVTSDGQRLYVTDLGYNRVLIWNTIPTANQAPADVAVGQPDLHSSLSNNSLRLCVPSGTDSNGAPQFPFSCNATLSFPRCALSDGTRLFIADGGNDRVLIYSRIPTDSGDRADYVVGCENSHRRLLIAPGQQRKIFDPYVQAPCAISGQSAWRGAFFPVAHGCRRREVEHPEQKGTGREDGANLDEQLLVREPRLRATFPAGRGGRRDAGGVDARAGRVQRRADERQRIPPLRPGAYSSPERFNFFNSSP